MGSCLHVLHSTCLSDVVESTASDIVNVFPKSLQSTESPELQVITFYVMVYILGLSWFANYLAVSL